MPTAAPPTPTPAKQYKNAWQGKAQDYQRQPVRVRVSLTWEHIEQGVRGDAYADAVALAVMDAMGEKLAGVDNPVCGNWHWICVRLPKTQVQIEKDIAYAEGRSDTSIIEPDLTWHKRAKVPHLLSVWIEQYDAGQDVQPIDFELDFE